MLKTDLLLKTNPIVTLQEILQNILLQLTLKFIIKNFIEIFLTGF